MKTLKDKLGTRAKRKVGNNTYIETRENGVALRLHSTDILLENGEGWTVDTGGWRTFTTKARLNDYLPVRIYQQRNVWYWDTGDLFTEGDKVLFDGTVQAQRKAEEAKGDVKLLRRINAYARLCAESAPMPEPGGGDCWYCHMTTEDGDSLGDATKDTGHLESHMTEKYVVPSLVFRALREAGNSDTVIAGAFRADCGFLGDIAKERVKKSVSKYLRRRFGLCS